jgi:endonuclease/exonuclease/phosphatase (EEP) superfamily protein YafD
MIGCRLVQMPHASHPRPGAGRLALALSFIAFVLGHQLIYLATFGADAGVELARTGHDMQWTLTVAMVVLLALGLATWAARELLRLARQAGATNQLAIDLPDAGIVHLVRDLLQLWLTSFAIALVFFVLFENGERLAAGLPAPGLAVLGSSSFTDPVLIFELVALATSLVAALYRWRRAVLVARIAAARRRWPRHASSAIPTAPDDNVRHALATRACPPGRAPPRISPS